MRRLRSNSARTASTSTTIFPVAVPVSMLSIRDTSFAPFALDLLHDLQEVKLGPGEAVQAVDGGLIPRPEQVEHPPKLGAIPFGSGRLLPKDVTVVHASLGQRLKLKRPVLIRGGDARIAEPASHRAETPCRMSDFSHGLFARQVPSETIARTAVHKLLSFWTTPSLVALSPCRGDDPTA